MINKNETWSPDSMDKRIRPLAYLFFILLVPILILFIEVLLNIIGYGVSYEPFVEFPLAPTYFTDNHKLLEKYYPTNLTPNNSLKTNLFSVPKEEHILRGIILGGSTAAGYPFYPNQSYSGILENALNKQNLHQFEILNLGNTAMSSYYVRDVASTLLKYQPDFIILLTGHNEYYGTISYSVNSSHIFNLVGTKLKEYKIYQLLSSLGHSLRQSQNDKTIMSELFSEKSFPLDQDVDSLVSNNFTENIVTALGIFSENNIPVFFVNPASNLMDMPPFFSGGTGSTSSNWPLTEVLTGIGSTDELNYSEFDSALQYWIEGSKSYSDLEKFYFFSSAKELDGIPFRARATITNAIRQLQQDFGDFAIPVDFENHLWRTFSIEGFSNSFFIDHLHLNFNGQVTLAKLLYQKISEYYNLHEDPDNLPYQNFNDWDSLKYDIGYYDFFSDEIMSRINRLVSNPPFSYMPVQYIPMEIEQGLPLLRLQDNDYNIEENMRITDILNLTSNIVMNSDDLQSKQDFLRAVTLVSPGDSETNRIVGNFLAENNFTDAHVLRQYRITVGFSFNPIETFAKIVRHLRQLERLTLLQNLANQLGFDLSRFDTN